MTSSLRSTISRFSQEKEPECERLKSNYVQKCQQEDRLGSLQRAFNSTNCEEDFVATANGNIGHLCAENVLRCGQLLQRFAGCEPVRRLLTPPHHAYRVKRFAEAV